MAQTTTNYGLLKPESTDSYNHQVYDNPNMDAIDAAMKSNADHSVDSATCIKTGTVHAVVRSNTDANVFKFTATGDWNTGDSMTVDGSPVSVFLPNGSAPLTGCYVINTEVIAVIQGSRVTLMCPVIPDASDIPYDNTSSQLTASDVQNAIDEVKGITDTLGTDITNAISTIAMMNGQNTLGVDVASVFTSATYYPRSTGLVYFRNSNQPANHPSWSEWGGYLFMKFTSNYGIVFAWSGTAFGYAAWDNNILGTWNRIN